MLRGEHDLDHVLTILEPRLLTFFPPLTHLPPPPSLQVPQMRRGLFLNLAEGDVSQEV